jgi:hypothetical protein
MFYHRTDWCMCNHLTPKAIQPLAIHQTICADPPREHTFGYLDLLDSGRWHG